MAGADGAGVIGYINTERLWPMLTPDTLATLAALISIKKKRDPIQCFDEAMALYFAASTYLIDIPAPELCGEVHDDPYVVCDLPKGHDGKHSGGHPASQWL